MPIRTINVGTPVGIATAVVVLLVATLVLVISLLLLKINSLRLFLWLHPIFWILIKII